MRKDVVSLRSTSDVFPVLFLWFLSAVVRIFMIQIPVEAVFKEKEMIVSVHDYLNRTFFSKKIPPTTGLLFSFFFYLMKIKIDSTKEGNITTAGLVLIRTITAGICSLLVPVSYLILRFVGCCRLSSFTASLFVLFENSFVVGTRFAQPTSFVLLFFSLTILFWVLFRKNEQKKKERGFLLLTGLFGGLVSSTELFGVFYYVPVIFLSILSLWLDLEDKPIKDLIKKTLKTIFYLIGIPFVVYFVSFYIHFSILTHKGDTPCLATRELQQSLIGGVVPETYKKVYYGSTVVIRQERPENGYLHSHFKRYPKGSKQQQVSVYHHQDDNNYFIVRKGYTAKSYTEEDTEQETEMLKELKDGDIIRLEHVTTGNFLHSHHIEAHMSNKKNNKEVSCYGNHQTKFSDSNDNWRIEIVDRKGNPINKNKQKKQQITAIDTFIRLKHVNVGCSLHSRNIRMEEWAGFQIEVTCGRQTLKKNSIWVIEENSHPLFGEEEEKISYHKKNKTQMFFEEHQKIFQTEKEETEMKLKHSSPFSWPFLKTKLTLWEKKDLTSIFNGVPIQRIILKGNKLVWLLGTFSVIFSVLFYLLGFFLNHLGIASIETNLQSMASSFVIWYLTSYVHQLFLTRTQTLFEYLPILYVSVLLFGVLFSFILKNISFKETVKTGLSGLLVSISVLFFLKNAAVTYGLWRTESALFVY